MLYSRIQVRLLRRCRSRGGTTGAKSNSPKISIWVSCEMPRIECRVGAVEEGKGKHMEDCRIWQKDVQAAFYIQQKVRGNKTSRNKT